MFLAVGEQVLDHVDEQTVRMASAFMGGAGGTQEEMCGVLSGGVMIAGALLGARRPGDDEEALKEALCFGWIDSKSKRLDEDRSMLWFAPRRPGSGWSRHNKESVFELTKAGLMTPAGLAKVEAAKRDGSWNALDAIEALEIPPDLWQELSANPAAQLCFEAFPPSTTRAILAWIASAKRPETRARRVAKTVRLAAQNIRARLWRK